MDMQLYALHVVPFIIIVYLIFLLFLRPSKEVLLASLLGGLTMGIINALADLLAFYAHWWHYSASGLILHLPLPFYITPILVFGGIVYLLIERFWAGRSHWFALLLLFGIPILGFARDIMSALSPSSSYLQWDSFLAGPLDFLLWLLMFYAGLLVFRRVLGALLQQQANPSDVEPQSEVEQEEAPPLK